MDKSNGEICVIMLLTAVFMVSTLPTVAAFGTDIQVNDDTGDAGQALGEEKTAVVMRDNVVYAVWQDWRNVSDNLRPDIFFAKGSIDATNNVTFHENVMVNDIPHSPLNDKPSAPAMAVGDDGSIYVVWTDMRNIDNQLEGVDVYFSRSTDGGTSFETNQLIGSTTGGSGAASIATAGNHVYIVYEHCCDPANNVLDFVISSNNGQSFGNLETIFIPSEGETGSGQPTIAAEGSNVYIAFQLKTTEDGGQVALMKSSNYGSSFSDPILISDDEGTATQSDISLAISGDHIYITWHDVREPAGVYFSVSHDQGSTFKANQLIIETGSSYPCPAISAYGDDVAISYAGRHEGIYGFVVITKISRDAGATWSNETIVSDTDVSRSGIGPSAVSVTDMGAGFLWIDSRGTWDENVFFDWSTFDDIGDGNGEEDQENGNGEPATPEKEPGFELLTLLTAITVALIIIKRRR
jgi:hypothetical protein